MLLHILAFPKSRRNEIAGVRNGRLMVKVTAPPEDGKANVAIVKLLAAALGIASSSIELATGPASREKTFAIPDMTSAQVTIAFNL